MSLAMAPARDVDIGVLPGLSIGVVSLSRTAAVHILTIQPSGG